MAKFQTIHAKSEGFFQDRGSRFLAFAFPVVYEEEVRACLRQTRKEYFNAPHHCYAYVIGLHRQTYGVHDDGEPNHAAGDPILGQIRSFGLTNVLVVVVRYFGGTQLGIGRLINAYKAAAGDALSRARVVEVFPR